MKILFLCSALLIADVSLATCPDLSGRYGNGSPDSNITYIQKGCDVLIDCPASLGGDCMTLRIDGSPQALYGGSFISLSWKGNALISVNVDAKGKKIDPEGWYDADYLSLNGDLMSACYDDNGIINGYPIVTHRIKN